jgi:hypothetical protein
MLGITNGLNSAGSCLMKYSGVKYLLDV